MGPASRRRCARVLEAAERLAYRPNVIARSLTTQRTNLVGVVMGGLEGPFQPYPFEALTHGLATLGKQPLLAATQRTGWARL